MPDQMNSSPGRNAFEAERRGTELVSPVAGMTPEDSHKEESEDPPDFTPADFQIDVTGQKATTCPAGYQSIDEYEQGNVTERVEIHFARSVCDTCAFRPRCPVKLNQHKGTYILKADLIKSTSSGVG